MLDTTKCIQDKILLLYLCIKYDDKALMTIVILVQGNVKHECKHWILIVATFYYEGAFKHPCQYTDNQSTKGQGVNLDKKSKDVR